MDILYLVYVPIRLKIFDYFHLQAITNSATMNICGRVFVWTFIFSSFRHILRNGNYGSYGLIICLTYWGTATLISKVITSFYIPTSKVWRCQIITIACCFPVSFVVVVNYNQASGCEVLFYCDFDLSFPHD